MRAHQIMTRDVITVRPDTTIEEAAKLMLRNHFSGLPVTDAYGELVGVASESDFLRRHEIGTGRKRPVWLQFLPGRAASKKFMTISASLTPIRASTWNRRKTSNRQLRPTKQFQFANPYIPGINCSRSRRKENKPLWLGL
jgi:hypothetical protein